MLSLRLTYCEKKCLRARRKTKPAPDRTAEVPKNKLVPVQKHSAHAGRAGWLAGWLVGLRLGMELGLDWCLLGGRIFGFRRLLPLLLLLAATATAITTTTSTTTTSSSTTTTTNLLFYFVRHSLPTFSLPPRARTRPSPSVLAALRGYSGFAPHLSRTPGTRTPGHDRAGTSGFAPAPLRVCTCRHVLLTSRQRRMHSLRLLYTLEVDRPRRSVFPDAAEVVHEMVFSNTRTQRRLLTFHIQFGHQSSPT